MYGLWLSLIPKMTPAKIRRIYDCCESAEELYHLQELQIKSIEGLTEEDKQSIIDSKKYMSPEKEWLKLQMEHISFVCQEDSAFPDKLRNIYNAPYCLFYKGKLPDENRTAVSIVGARECSGYGGQIAFQLGKELAKNDIEVISGMARGVDGEGHKGALEGNGATYAVLGCGVDICYPRQNRNLYENISKNGGILSEYPMGTEPQNIFFPQRNRIISGLSDYVVVIEARKKSGSLITADFAMEQGREVYVLPGRICDPLSQGCNELIRQGAGIFTSIEDLLSDMKLIDTHPMVQMDLQKFLLEKDETLVYSLFDFAPMGIGTLTQKSPYGLLEIMDILNRLEQKGLVKEVIPNYYIKKI